ncbi:MAG TPA: substrate-binding domain-containing protein [Ruminiclostridium sp.]|nr:substrate-binding domain-containing protein [Ruminiclostridium sp.]
MRNESRTPLYAMIKDYINKQIADGTYNANDKLPPEAELMKAFNVSRITVTKALTEMADEGIVYRIPGRGTYVSGSFGNSPADISETNKSRIKDQSEDRTAITESHPEGSSLIGFTVPTLDGYFSTNILNGIKKSLDERGYSLLIQISFDKTKEEQAIRNFIKFGVDGMIIFPVDQETYNEEILSLKVNHFPFVLVDRYLPGIDTSYVISNNVLGGKLAVSHLYELGHRNIAICTSTMLPTSSTSDRITGYLNELAERGIKENSDLIIKDIDVSRFESSTDSSSENDIVSAENSGNNLLLIDVLKHRKATAFIVTDGKTAVYISEVCKHLKIRIPEDISLICFDDPSYTPFNSSFFTHIKQSERSMGYKSGEIIVDLLKQEKNESIHEYHKIILDPELVVRKSSGPVSMK